MIDANMVAATFAEKEDGEFARQVLGCAHKEDAVDGDDRVSEDHFGHRTLPA